MGVLIPVGPRSATAVDGVSGFTDQNIHSAILLQDGAQGNGKMFTVPQGQGIPAMKGAATLATANGWQQTYTRLTTIMEKAGELGNGIGDINIRAISVHIEQAPNLATGLVATGAAAWGATDLEIAEICGKTSIELRVGKKPYFNGRSADLPSMGGVNGSIATGTVAKAQISQLGNPGLIRRLRSQIQVARNDTLTVDLEVAGNSALAFRETGSGSNPGAPTLYYVILPSFVRGDAR